MIGETELARLDDRQRRQVAENIGLVTVHLRRHVPGRAPPTRDREWEDLFQEGCLGLIQAVCTFRMDSGIAFPAYALPRIHTAVSRALRGGFATVRQPLYPRRHGADEARCALPGVRTLDFDPQDRRPDPRHAIDRSATGGTVGERLRARYVQAVGRVVRQMKRSRPARQDRAHVLDRIVEERLLVPDSQARTSLRAIARETDSSYARIAKCEKRILDQVRADLADDAETQHLREAARRNPDGMATPIDAGLIDELEQLRIDRFVAQIEAGPPLERASRLLEAFDRAGLSLGAVARSWLATLTPRQRVACLAAVGDPTTGSSPSSARVGASRYRP